MSEATFDTWGIVELFGHQRIAGKLTEQQIAGTTMLRVDVPTLEFRGRQLSLEAPIPVETRAGFTKFYGAGAIYGITPTDEQTARLAAAALHMEPVERWQLEAAQRALVGAVAEDDPDMDQDGSGPF
jgi:hypothetical protein